jgi:alkanesulfonate monooxygenase SsuD/methylene tetrahydromethanopterin reductase-like flavin-dependent oxidoreductase (luciferase family)
VGLVVPQAAGSRIADPSAVWKLVDAADASGPSAISDLWVSDHLLWWRPTYEALTLLAGIGARTSRVRIGTAVLLLALRPPVLAAKTLASIDRLSGGRLTVGVGVGGEYAPEWEAAGVPRRGRGRRTEEMIRTLRRLWAGADSGELEPKPARLPPVWIGGRSETAQRRAGRLGDGWMGLFITPERYAAQLAVVREAAERAGRDPAAVAPSLYVWTAIRDTAAEARAAAEALLPSFYHVPFHKLERYVVMGTPEECAETLSAFVGAGVRHFAVAPVVEEVSTEPVAQLTRIASLLHA